MKLKPVTVLLFIMALADFSNLQSQVFVKDYISFFDSIDNRITILQQQLPALKASRDVAYYNMQRELDFALFLRNYEKFVMDEDLEAAKDIAERSLAQADSKKDQHAADFYGRYLEKSKEQLKLRLMHYQDLLSKENKFRQAYKQTISPGTRQAYEKALKMTDLALKYANEYNINSAASYLQLYRNEAEAVIYDFDTEYDLFEITSDSKKFEYLFMPLTESDSLEGLKEAEKLLTMCLYYSRLMETGLDTAYLSDQSLMIATALSDVLSREGRERDIEKYTDIAIAASADTLNPTGVFKWNEFIVVIDEFVPTSGFTNVKSGEAIIHADRMLATYLVKNRLCKNGTELDFGRTYLIPYNSQEVPFYYNQLTRKWQYMVCYTRVLSDEFTKKAGRLMPPMHFEQQPVVAEN